MISSFPTRGVLENCRQPLAICRGSFTILCTLYRPTTGGRHFPLAREGGVNAAQFGVARFSGGSSWKTPEAPADEGGHPRFWMARLVDGTGSP